MLWANPEIKPISFPKDEKVKLSFRFPESVAAVEDSFKSPSHQVTSHQKTIYLFQDAHTNESGQRNLSKALSTLLDNEKDIRYVFTEAGVENNSLTFLRDKAPLNIRKLASEVFLKKGLLHGSEFLQLTTDQNFILWGVEDMNLYNKALSNYKDVAKSRSKLKDYLSKINVTLKTLQSKILNPVLDSYLSEYLKYQHEEMSLTDYFDKLNQFSEGFSLVSYPHLSLLKELKQKESDIDFVKANTEQAEFMKTLSADDKQELTELIKTSPNRVGVNGHTQKAFYALLEEKVTRSQSHKVTKCPELRKYFEYLKLSKKLEAKQVLDELARLENELFSKLALSQEEQVFLKSTKLLVLYDKLFNLTLTTDEYSEYKGLSQNFTINELAGFLNQQIMKLNSYYERALFLEKGYEEAVLKSEEFYELTLKRDEAFITKMLSKMTAEGQDKAALIAGGYHASNLKNLFKSKNISFISIVPQILNETNQKRYESILFDQKLIYKQTPSLNLQNTGRMLMPVALSMTLSLAEYEKYIQVTPMPSHRVTGSQGHISEGARLAGEAKPQKIAVIGGAGFVGLTNGVMLASMGHDVTAVDIDSKKINRLSRGEMVQYIPKLGSYLKNVVDSKHMRFTKDLHKAIEGREIILLALPTPQSDSGEADITFLEGAVKRIARAMKPGEKKILLGMSTAPPDTIDKLKAIAKKILDEKEGAQIQFAWKPEYLKEGEEVDDWLKERVVIGTDDRAVAEKLRALYQISETEYPSSHHQFIFTDIKSAMFNKYVANGMLATKISFINLIGWISEAYGFDIKKVADIIGQDPRVIRSFLNAGLGFGGSCFPKDVNAFVHIAGQAGVYMGLLVDVLAINDVQWSHFVDRADIPRGRLNGKKVIVLGAAFKPNTDDIRESRAIPIIRKLLRKGAKVEVYDPKVFSATGKPDTFAGREFKKIFGKRSAAVTYHSDLEQFYGSAAGAEAIFLVTEWREYREIDFSRIKAMSVKRKKDFPRIFDGRNAWDEPNLTHLGFKYQGIGRSFNANLRPKDLASEELFADLVARLYYAVRVTMANKVAGMVEGTGANVHDVLFAAGSDARIGTEYLTPGIGWGGQYLPEAIYQMSRLMTGGHVPEFLSNLLASYDKARARHMARLRLAYPNIPDEAHVSSILPITTAVTVSNEMQVSIYVQKIKEVLGGSLKGKKLAVLGLAYKPGSYATEGSPALELVAKLIQEGAIIQATDALQQTIENAQYDITPHTALKFFKSPKAAVKGTDAQLVVVGSEQFRGFQRILEGVSHPLVIDVAHLYHDPLIYDITQSAGDTRKNEDIPLQMAKLGIRYVSIGVPTPTGARLSDTAFDAEERLREEADKSEYQGIQAELAALEVRKAELRNLLAGIEAQKLNLQDAHDSQDITSDEYSRHISDLQLQESHANRELQALLAEIQTVLAKERESLKKLNGYDIRRRQLRQDEGRVAVDNMMELITGAKEPAVLEKVWGELGRILRTTAGLKSGPMLVLLSFLQRNEGIDSILDFKSIEGINVTDDMLLSIQKALSGINPQQILTRIREELAAQTEELVPQEEALQLISSIQEELAKNEMTLEERSVLGEQVKVLSPDKTQLIKMTPEARDHLVGVLRDVQDRVHAWKQGSKQVRNLPRDGRIFVNYVVLRRFSDIIPTTANFETFKSIVFVGTERANEKIVKRFYNFVNGDHKKMSANPKKAVIQVALLRRRQDGRIVVVPPKTPDTPDQIKQKEFVAREAAIMEIKSKAQALTEKNMYMDLLAEYVELESLLQGLIRDIAAQVDQGTSSDDIMLDYIGQHLRLEDLLQQISQEMDTSILYTAVRLFVSGLSQSQLKSITSIKTGKAAWSGLEGSLLNLLPQRLGEDRLRIAKREFVDRVSARIHKELPIEVKAPSGRSIALGPQNAARPADRDSKLTAFEYSTFIESELAESNPAFGDIAWALGEMPDGSVRYEALDRVVDWAKALPSTPESLEAMQAAAATLQLPILDSVIAERVKGDPEDDDDEGDSGHSGLDTLEWITPEPQQIAAVYAVLKKHLGDSVLDDIAVKKPNLLERVFQLVAPGRAISLGTGQKVRLFLEEVGDSRVFRKKAVEILKELVIYVHSPEEQLRLRLRSLLERHIKGPQAQSLIEIYDTYAHDFQKATKKEGVSDGPDIGMAYKFKSSPENKAPSDFEGLTLIFKDTWDDSLIVGLIGHLARAKMVLRILEANRSGSNYSKESIDLLINSGYFYVLASLWVLKHIKEFRLKPSEEETLRLSVIHLMAKKDNDKTEAEVADLLGLDTVFGAEWYAYMGTFVYADPKDRPASQLLEQAEPAVLKRWIDDFFAAAQRNPFLPLSAVLANPAGATKTIPLSDFQKQVEHENKLAQITAAYRRGLIPKKPDLETLQLAIQMQEIAKTLPPEKIYRASLESAMAFRDRIPATYSQSQLELANLYRFAISGLPGEAIMGEVSFTAVDAQRLNSDPQHAKFARKVKRQKANRHETYRGKQLITLRQSVDVDAKDTVAIDRPNADLETNPTLLVDHVSKVIYVPSDKGILDDVFIVARKTGYANVLITAAGIPYNILPVRHRLTDGSIKISASMENKAAFVTAEGLISRTLPGEPRIIEALNGSGARLADLAHGAYPGETEEHRQQREALIQELWELGIHRIYSLKMVDPFTGRDYGRHTIEMLMTLRYQNNYTKNDLWHKLKTKIVEEVQKNGVNAIYIDWRLGVMDFYSYLSLMPGGFVHVSVREQTDESGEWVKTLDYHPIQVRNKKFELAQISIEKTGAGDVQAIVRINEKKTKRVTTAVLDLYPSVYENLSQRAYIEEVAGVFIEDFSENKVEDLILGLKRILSSNSERQAQALPAEKPSFASYMISPWINFLAGTWYVGSGMTYLENDRVYDFMKRIAEFKIVALLRALGMKYVAIPLVRLKSFLGRSPQKNIDERFIFYNESGEEIDDKDVSFLFFPGSGIDRERKKDIGLRDLALLKKIFGSSAASTKAYLYRSFPGAWFDRLGEGYYQAYDPARAGVEASQFVDSLLVSRIATASGEKLDPQTLQKNLTLFWAGQSYGGTFAIQVVNALARRMEAMGYTSDEIQDAVSNIFIFSISGAIPVDYKGPYPTIVSIEDVRDFIDLQMPRGIFKPSKFEARSVVPFPGHRFHWVSNKLDGAEIGEGHYGYHDVRVVLGNLPDDVFNSVKEALDRKGAPSGARLSGLTDEEISRLTPQYDNATDFIASSSVWRAKNPESTLLGLVRHPESTSNLFHYTQSYIGFSPPTIRGYLQRNAFATFLRSMAFKFNRYISTDLERAFAGIEIAARNAGKEVEFLKRFREANIMWMPNLQRSQVAELNDKLFNLFMDDPFNFEIPGWSGKRFKKFMQQFLDQTAQERGPDKNILIGLHGLTLVLTVMVALDIPSEKYREAYKRLGETSNLGLLFLSYNPSQKKWELLTRVDDSYLPQELRGKTTSKLMKSVENVFFVWRFFYRLFIERWALGRQSQHPDYFPTMSPMIPLSDEQLKVIETDHYREMTAGMNSRPDSGARLAKVEMKVEDQPLFVTIYRHRTPRNKFSRTPSFVVEFRWERPRAGIKTSSFTTDRPQTETEFSFARLIVETIVQQKIDVRKPGHFEKLNQKFIFSLSMPKAALRLPVHRSYPIDPNHTVSMLAEVTHSIPSSMQRFLDDKEREMGAELKGGEVAFVHGFTFWIVPHDVAGTAPIHPTRVIDIQSGAVQIVPKTSMNPAVSSATQTQQLSVINLISGDTVFSKAYEPPFQFFVYGPFLAVKKEGRFILYRFTETKDEKIRVGYQEVPTRLPFKSEEEIREITLNDDGQLSIRSVEGHIHVIELQKLAAGARLALSDHIDFKTVAAMLITQSFQGSAILVDWLDNAIRFTAPPSPNIQSTFLKLTVLSAKEGIQSSVIHLTSPASSVYTFFPDANKLDELRRIHRQLASLFSNAAVHSLSSLVAKLSSGQELTDEEFRSLVTLTLRDPKQVKVFGVTSENVAEKLRQRIPLFQQTLPQFNALMKESDINDLDAEKLWSVYVPLSLWIFERKMKVRRHEGYIAGFTGSIGIGKTTRTQILELVLSKLLEPRGEKVITISLDDLYKLKKDRASLAGLGYKFRGPPGMHDVELGLDVLHALRYSNEQSTILIPQFDKGADDRKEPRKVHGKFGIILLEGWFLGADTYINSLQVEPGFKRIIAQALKEYEPLFNEMDDLVVRNLRSLDAIKAMYRDQVMRQKAVYEAAGKAWAGLTEEQIDPFVEFLYVDSWDVPFSSPEPAERQSSIVIETGDDREIISMRLGGRITGVHTTNMSMWAAAKEIKEFVLTYPEDGQIQLGESGEIIKASEILSVKVNLENSYFEALAMKAMALLEKAFSEKGRSWNTLRVNYAQNGSLVKITLGARLSLLKAQMEKAATSDELMIRAAGARMAALTSAIEDHQIIDVVRRLGEGPKSIALLVNVVRARRVLYRPVSRYAVAALLHWDPAVRDAARSLIMQLQPLGRFNATNGSDRGNFISGTHSLIRKIMMRVASNAGLTPPALRDYRKVFGNTPMTIITLRNAFGRQILYDMIMIEENEDILVELSGLVASYEHDPMFTDLELLAWFKKLIHSRILGRGRIRLQDLLGARDMGYWVDFGDGPVSMTQIRRVGIEYDVTNGTGTHHVSFNVQVKKPDDLDKAIEALNRMAAQNGQQLYPTTVLTVGYKRPLTPSTTAIESLGARLSQNLHLNYKEAPAVFESTAPKATLYQYQSVLNEDRRVDIGSKSFVADKSFEPVLLRHQDDRGQDFYSLVFISSENEVIVVSMIPEPANYSPTDLQRRVLAFLTTIPELNSLPVQKAYLMELKNARVGEEGIDLIISEFQADRFRSPGDEQSGQRKTYWRGAPRGEGPFTKKFTTPSSGARLAMRQQENAIPEFEPTRRILADPVVETAAVSSEVPAGNLIQDFLDAILEGRSLWHVSPQQQKRPKKISGPKTVKPAALISALRLEPSLNSITDIKQIVTLTLPWNSTVRRLLSLYLNRLGGPASLPTEDELRTALRSDPRKFRDTLAKADRLLGSLGHSSRFTAGARLAQDAPARGKEIAKAEFTLTSDNHVYQPELQTVFTAAKLEGSDAGMQGILDDFFGAMKPDDAGDPGEYILLATSESPVAVAKVSNHVGPETSTTPGFTRMIEVFPFMDLQKVRSNGSTFYETITNGLILRYDELVNIRVVGVPRFAGVSIKAKTPNDVHHEIEIWARLDEESGSMTKVGARLSADTSALVTRQAVDAATGELHNKYETGDWVAVLNSIPGIGVTGVAQFNTNDGLEWWLAEVVQVDAQQKTMMVKFKDPATGAYVGNNHPVRLDSEHVGLIDRDKWAEMTGARLAEKSKSPGHQVTRSAVFAQDTTRIVEQEVSEAFKSENMRRQLQGKALLSQDKESDLQRKLMAQNEKANLVLDQAFDQLIKAGHAGLVETLMSLYLKALPYYVKGQDVSPLHHVPHVMNILAKIMLESEVKNESDLKVGMITALLHDIGNGNTKLQKITTSEIKEHPEKLNEAIAFRNEHVDRGLEIINSLHLVEAGIMSSDEFNALVSIVKRHDHPTTAKLLKDNGATLTRDYFILNEPDERILAFHREADRLWMLTADGVDHDLKGKIQERRIAQIYKNIKSHRDEYDVYVFAHEQGVIGDFSTSDFKHKTLYRTEPGYRIYENSVKALLLGALGEALREDRKVTYQIKGVDPLSEVVHAVSDVESRSLDNVQSISLNGVQVNNQELGKVMVQANDRVTVEFSTGARLAMEILRPDVKLRVKLVILQRQSAVLNPMQNRFIPGVDDLIGSLQKRGIRVVVMDMMALRHSFGIRPRDRKMMVGNYGLKELYDDELKPFIAEQGLSNDEIVMIGNSRMTSFASALRIPSIGLNDNPVMSDALRSSGTLALVHNFRSYEQVLETLPDFLQNPETAGARLAETERRKKREERRGKQDSKLTSLPSSFSHLPSPSVTAAMVLSLFVGVASAHAMELKNPQEFPLVLGAPGTKADVFTLHIPGRGELQVADDGGYTVYLNTTGREKKINAASDQIISQNVRQNVFVKTEVALIQTQESLVAHVIEALSEAARTKEVSIRFGFIGTPSELEVVGARLSKLDSLMGGKLLGTNGIYNLSGRDPENYQIVDLLMPGAFEPKENHRYAFLDASEGARLSFNLAFAGTTGRVDLSDENPLDSAYVHATEIVTGNRKINLTQLRDLIRGRIVDPSIQKLYDWLPDARAINLSQTVSAFGSRLAAILQAA